MSAADLILTGDLILDEPDPDYWLAGITARTASADFTLGHLEVPHTRAQHELAGDVPAPGADPANLGALKRAGFSAVTLAGNHIADCGAEGIADTRTALSHLGIGCCGAGNDRAAAFAPLTAQVAGRRVVVLSYNCVGPEASWATHSRAGCAYVKVDTVDGRPVAPAASLTTPDPASLQEMRRQITDAKAAADLVIVALHKGLLHRPATLAAYERPLAHAAIDAGADVVIGHHAHIIRGIEYHKGRPIFHGLGNGCVVTRALSPEQDHPARAAWAKKRKQLFGFEPDPAFYLAPFHPEARHAMLGRLLWHDDGRIEAGFVPVLVKAPGRPTLAGGDEAQAIVDYVKKITVDAGLPPLSLSARQDWTVVRNAAA